MDRCVGRENPTAATPLRVGYTAFVSKSGILAADTSRVIEDMQISHWRAQDPVARFGILANHVRTARFLMRVGAGLRLPAASQNQVEHSLAIAWVGHDVPAGSIHPASVEDRHLIEDPDPFAIAARVSATLGVLAVRHVVVGSLASIAYGEPRLTRDADLVADLTAADIPSFVRAIEADFFVDEISVEEAIHHRGSFNVLHRATMFKVDIFSVTDRLFDNSRIERATRIYRGGQSLPLATPEDTLLAKLVWYRKGNEVSDVQWRDVLGILLVTADALDNDYLDKWSRSLGIDDLMDRARKAATGRV
jgi:hypothetical protein